MDVARSSLAFARLQTWRWALWLPGSMLLASAVLFAMRRLTGALEEPLPTTTLLAAMVLASLAALVTVRAVDITQAVGWCVASVAAALVVMLGAALSVPGTSSTALTMLWLSTLVMVGAIATDVIVRGRVRGEHATAQAARHTPMALGEARAIADPHDKAPDDRDVWQQLSRARTEDGEDRLEGWVRVECSAGQRGEVVHLAFCPPFQRIPKLEAHCQSGPSARIKVTQLLPYAARIELRLDAMPQEQTSLVIGLSATCPAADATHDTV